ncbi:O-antigen polymerase [Thiomicrospira sp.]|uniref:O-antigen polymerase n=1 Tax=Thiomicrospira sp. TaxID=935 RepID=UPI002F9440F4
MRFLFPKSIRFYVPLIIIQFYLFISVGLFFWGPWPWPYENGLSLFLYLIFSQFLILLGYFLGISVSYRNNADYSVSFSKRFYRLSIIFSIILLVPTTIARTGHYFPFFFTGIEEIGVAYNIALQAKENIGLWVSAEYLRIVFSVFLISLYPLTVFYWPILTLREKIISLVVLIWFLSIYITTGTNKFFADILITIYFLYLLQRYAFYNPGWMKKIKIFIFLFFMAIFFIYFFAYGQLTRDGGVGEFAVFNTGAELIYAQRYEGLPVILQVFVESISRYLTQGYYALDLAFRVESSPSTFGLGGSYFLAENANSLFGTSYFTESSLPGLIEYHYGWSMYQLWHSIYPWLASDFGFLGALLMLGFFSFLLAFSWKRSVLYRDPFMVVIAYLTIILFFYVPANNQVFQFGEYLVGFMSLFLYAFFFRKIKWRK